MAVLGEKPMAIDSSPPRRIYGLLQTRPHGSPAAPIGALGPPGELRAAPLPLRCWIPPVRAPGQDSHLRSQRPCPAHLRSPCRLAPLSARTTQLITLMTHRCRHDPSFRSPLHGSSDSPENGPSATRSGRATSRSTMRALRVASPTSSFRSLARTTTRKPTNHVSAEPGPAHAQTNERATVSAHNTAGNGAVRVANSTPARQHASDPPRITRPEPQHPRPDGDRDRFQRIRNAAPGRHDRPELGIQHDRPPREMHPDQLSALLEPPQPATHRARAHPQPTSDRSEP